MSGPQTLAPGPRALVDALEAEYAAVFAYGLVAAFSNPDRGPLVVAHTAAHRARRDATIDALTAANIDVPEPAAGYSVPIAVVDPVSAARLVVRVETDTAVAWRSVIERSDTEATRADAITALTDAAARAATWRAFLRITPSTVAFPGSP